MEPLNWTQEHKSVWDGPASKATGHAPGRARLARAAVVPPAGELASSRTRRPLRSPALVIRADFLKMVHFAPFSQFLHIKGRKFPDVFNPFTSAYDPYEPWKVSWKSVRTFLRNPENRQTDRQTQQLYIYRCLFAYCKPLQMWRFVQLCSN